MTRFDLPGEERLILTVNPGSAAKLREIAFLRGTSETQAACDSVATFHELMGHVDDGGRLLVHYPDRQETLALTLPDSGPPQGAVEEDLREASLDAPADEVGAAEAAAEPPAEDQPAEESELEVAAAPVSRPRARARDLALGLVAGLAVVLGVFVAAYGTQLFAAGIVGGEAAGDIVDALLWPIVAVAVLSLLAVLAWRRTVWS